MMAAFVMIQVTVSADLAAVHSALHAIAGVKTVHFLAGPTDAIAFVEAANQAGLMEALGKIRATNGVASTDTRIVWPM